MRRFTRLERLWTLHHKKDPAEWSARARCRNPRCVRRGAWHGKVKRRGSAGVRGCPQTAAVPLDDRAADRQSHAGALRLGAETPLEDLISVFARQPGSRVAHGDGEVAIGRNARRDGHFSARGLHSLDALENEVHQHLPELHEVDCDEGRIRRQVRAKRYRAFGRLAAQRSSMSRATSFTSTISRTDGVSFCITFGAGR
jgi:hypothetical protein